MTKREKNKSQFAIVGSFLLIISFCLIFSYKYYNYSINKNESKLINEFFINSNITNDETAKIPVSSSTKQDNYIGILEIPRINVKKGFLNINDKNNNINKNIQVLKKSIMPDVENSLLVIAGHSGNSVRSFFKNVYKLNLNDDIYVYYKGVKYIYKIVDIFNEDKDGTIEISKPPYQALVLTTCNQVDRSKQILVMAKLIDKIKISEVDFNSTISN